MVNSMAKSVQPRGMHGIILHPPHVHSVLNSHDCSSLHSQIPVAALYCLGALRALEDIRRGSRSVGFLVLSGALGGGANCSVSGIGA